MGWGQPTVEGTKLSERERWVLVEALRKEAGMGGGAVTLADGESLELSPQHIRSVARDLYFRYLNA